MVPQRTKALEDVYNTSETEAAVSKIGLSKFGEDQDGYSAQETEITPQNSQQILG
jgi:hypothetical protein